MKIIEITYSKGQTIQLKQFEPVNVHYSIKAEVNEKEDLVEAYKQLSHVVDKQVYEKLESLKTPF